MAELTGFGTLVTQNARSLAGHSEPSLRNSSARVARDAEDRRTLRAQRLYRDAPAKANAGRDPAIETEPLFAKSWADETLPISSFD